MTDQNQPTQRPGFVVLRQLENGNWEVIGEFARRPGLTSKAARTRAILEATQGEAKAGDSYAAVLKSEWKIGMDW